MKNKLIKGIFGFGLMISLFAITTGVYANTYDGATLDDSNNSTNEEVVVGNVEVPVYSADIFWDSLSFDWVYDSNTKSFDWEPTPICTNYYSEEGMSAEEAIASGMTLYSDNTCSTKVYSYDANVEKYYSLVEREHVSIGLEDMSQNGEIVPSIKWVSSEKYNNVVGTFEYINQNKTICTIVNSEEMLNIALENTVTLYSDSDCSTIVADENPVYAENQYYAFVNIVSHEKLVTDEIPNEARCSGAGSFGTIYRFTEIEKINEEISNFPKRMYSILVSVENVPGQEIVTPTTGDVIGTITISIRAK